MQYIITGKQPNQLTNCGEAKKGAINTQTVRAKKKTQLSHGGQTNPGHCNMCKEEPPNT